MLLDFIGIIIWACCFHSSISSERTFPGVWVDDGTGHTVKTELLEADAQILRKNLLAVLGLPEPLHRKHHTIKTNGSAPTFLKSIYDALDERGHAPNLEAHYKTTVDEADVIITFINKNSKYDYLQGHHHRRYLHFELKEMPKDLSLLAAELRIYRHYSHVTVYEELVIHIYVGHKDKDCERRIAKAILPKQGWISFNISIAISKWFSSPDSNEGIRIAVTRLNHKHELHLTDVGISSGHNDDNYRPFVVGFFTEISKKEIVHHSREIRSANPTTKFNPIRDFTEMSEDIDHRKKKNKGTAKDRCSKRNMYVSFEVLGWQDWVIAPNGYNANYCDGKCRFPMLANMNATNHAIIQTLVKMKSSTVEAPPEVCCAPRDLTTISVLYIDYSNNVVLKKYPKMIVKTCGCI